MRGVHGDEVHLSHQTMVLETVVENDHLRTVRRDSGEGAPDPVRVPHTPESREIPGEGGEFVGDLVL